jgi:hypothetical protein
VQAAFHDHGALDAGVSLSAERSVGANLREILPLARRIRLPSPYVGSRDDGYTTFGRDTRQFHQVTPAKVNRMLLVPGGDHGVDLLSDENGPGSAGRSSPSSRRTPAKRVGGGRLSAARLRGRYPTFDAANALTMPSP